MGHWLDGQDAFCGQRLSSESCPIMWSRAHRCTDFMHARNTDTVFFCAVFCGYVAGSHPTRTKEPAQAQERSEHKSQARSVAIHLSSALSRFCARSVPPTQCPEWTIMGYFGSSHSPFQNYERQTRTRGPHDPAALSMHEADQHSRIIRSTERYSRSHPPLNFRHWRVPDHDTPTLMNNPASTMATVVFHSSSSRSARSARVSKQVALFPYWLATGRKAYAVAS